MLENKLLRLRKVLKKTPGAYFDHSQNAWFCSVCQNFGVLKAGEKQAWFTRRVQLGNVAGKCLAVI